MAASHSGARSLADHTHGARWGNLAWAAWLVSLGSLLLAYNLGAVSASEMRAIVRWWPSLLVLAGMLLAFTGRVGPGYTPELFVLERGGAQSARLTARLGVVDLRLRDIPEAQAPDEAEWREAALIAGRYAGPYGPEVDEMVGGEARIRFERAATPLAALDDWAANLTPDLPWTLDLESSLGDFDLDLAKLNVHSLSLKTSIGDVTLRLPEAADCQAGLTVAVGDVDVRLPPEAGVRVSLQRGPLSSLQLPPSRFRRLGADRWETPDFEQAPQRITLQVTTRLGDVRLR